MRMRQVRNNTCATFGSSWRAMFIRQGESYFTCTLKKSCRPNGLTW